MAIQRPDTTVRLFQAIAVIYGPSIPVEMLKDESVEAFEKNVEDILIEVRRLMMVDELSFQEWRCHQKNR